MVSAPTLRLVSDAPLPITAGDLLDFPADPIALMRKLQRQHGDVAAFADQSGAKLYFIFSPELNHQVLSDTQTFHSRFFALRGPRNSPQRRLSSGLLSMNGDQHKRQRRLMMEAFLKRAIQGYIPSIRTHIEDCLAHWRPGEERDIARDMTEFMLRLTSSMLFGMESDETVAYRIGRMIDHWVNLNHELGMGLFVSSPEITGRYDELLGFAGELELEIAGLIRERRKVGGAGHDVLSMILQAHDEQGVISDDELVGQAALVFAAAHLTTAHSLTWTLLLLAQHPDVMQALNTELRQQLSGGFPTLEATEQLPILERVIKESMRVLPASSYSQRMTTQPVQLGPFQVPCSAGVIFSQFMTHHNADLYPEPEAFRPDRWIDLNPLPYAYLPFGAGPRMCVGGPLAMTILKTVIPTILQRFKLTSVPYSEVSSRVISTMLSPTTPVLMQIDAQDSQFEAQPVVGNIHALVDLPHACMVGVRRAA